MDGGAISTSAISSVFTATLKISQVIYELNAVGEQTRRLLDTTKHLNDSLDRVRMLRRQKSALLNATEKAWIDDEISNTKGAVSDIAALIEPARVDMEIHKDQKYSTTSTKNIKLHHRAMFVLRDSPKIAVNLTNLSIAHQGLTAAMVILANREGQGHLMPLGDNSKGVGRRSSSPIKAPPPYDEHEFLNRRRTITTAKSPLKMSKPTPKPQPLDVATLSPSDWKQLRALRSMNSWEEMEEDKFEPRSRSKEPPSNLSGDSNVSFTTPVTEDEPRIDESRASSPACVPIFQYTTATPPALSPPKAWASNTGGTESSRVGTPQPRGNFSPGMILPYPGNSRLPQIPLPSPDNGRDLRLEHYATHSGIFPDVLMSGLRQSEAQRSKFEQPQPEAPSTSKVDSPNHEERRTALPQPPHILPKPAAYQSYDVRVAGPAQPIQKPLPSLPPRNPSTASLSSVKSAPADMGSNKNMTRGRMLLERLAQKNADIQPT